MIYSFLVAIAFDLQLLIFPTRYDKIYDALMYLGANVGNILWWLLLHLFSVWSVSEFSGNRWYKVGFRCYLSAVLILFGTVLAANIITSKWLDERNDTSALCSRESKEKEAPTLQLYRFHGQHGQDPEGKYESLEKYGKDLMKYEDASRYSPGELRTTLCSLVNQGFGKAAISEGTPPCDPLAKSDRTSWCNESDQPVCRVCDIVLKSDFAWSAH
ncbi:hypothetical protein L6452_20135 [Arctium lappa]|uniref:Uncharacterized protein n=1 Tax=Arctium lappa TaxID=4217 RepID=A0ACB9BAL8_ARCLA|nr:hypothetical protein L6452_20135 [Arctium lappa]